MPKAIAQSNIVRHKGQVFSLEETLDFAKWLAKEPDRKGRAIIVDALNGLRTEISERSARFRAVCSR